MNPGNFTLPCTIGSLNFYAMADLGASVNAIPKSMFEHLKLAQLKKTGMIVEMADMTKRSLIGIIENVLIKIYKFLFPSDFVVMDMLNTRNETMILGRPFLETIHAKIDVFNKEISVGIGGDRVTFDMNKKIHNFTTPVGKIYQGTKKQKDEDAKIDMLNTLWPTCDPTLKACNGGIGVYGMNKEGNLKRWYCYLDDNRGSIKGGGLSFPGFLLVGHTEVSELVKKALLKTWLFDCFQEELAKDLRSRGNECMTRSSTSELFTPYKEPEQEFQLSRRHFKTLSLDELRSPDFNLFSDQEYSEEEEVEIMAETMEQYMSKTRADYRLGVARPKIKDKDNFELKGQFLKELRTNTFSGSDHEDANEHIEKVLEIFDLFHILNITIDQVMLIAFPMSLTRAASRWLRNEPTGSITT
ncbi:reverse transcriptase domain-containing protein [Tanacetum coccineum]